MRALSGVRGSGVTETSGCAARRTTVAPAGVVSISSTTDCKFSSHPFPCIWYGDEPGCVQPVLPARWRDRR